MMRLEITSGIELGMRIMLAWRIRATILNIGQGQDKVYIRYPQSLKGFSREKRKRRECKDFQDINIK